jgi:hypothetical protein
MGEAAALASVASLEEGKLPHEITWRAAKPA